MKLRLFIRRKLLIRKLTKAKTKHQQRRTRDIQDENASGAAFVAIEDDPLIVDVSDIADSDGMGTSQIQWQISRDSKNWLNLSGAVQQSFTPREVHVDQYLRVVISYVDGQGKLETLISPPSTPVKNINDKPTGSPRLSGEAREKSTLVVDASLISDEDGIGSYGIIWQQSKTAKQLAAVPVNGRRSSSAHSKGCRLCIPCGSIVHR